MGLSQNVSRHLIRSFSTTKIYNTTSSLVKLKKLQADFQAETGQPIWLKAGFKDRLLVGTTYFACFNGILMTFACIYDHAKPSSWKKSD